jgi:hypothetical protein
MSFVTDLVGNGGMRAAADRVLALEGSGTSRLAARRTSAPDPGGLSLSDPVRSVLMLRMELLARLTPGAGPPTEAPCLDR